jgi:hypothetical protein
MRFQIVAPQVARLDIKDGNMVCGRNAEFPFSLKPGVDN